jgi:hypothetical protein
MCCETRRLVNDIDPEVKMLKKLINPVHYGTFEHYKEPSDNIKRIKDERINIAEVGSKTKIEF